MDGGIEPLRPDCRQREIRRERKAERVRVVDRVAISAGSDFVEQPGRDRVETADRRNVVDKLNLVSGDCLCDTPRRIEILGHRLVEEYVLAGPSGLLDPRGLLVRRASQCDDVNSRIFEQGVRRWREIEACRRTQAGDTSRIIFPTGDDDGLRLLLQRKRHELAMGAAVADDSHAIALGHLPASHSEADVGSLASVADAPGPSLRTSRDEQRALR